MIEIVTTNDPVKLSFIEAVLKEAGIRAVVLDAETAGMFGGALPWVKRRVLVPDEQAAKARSVLADALDPSDKS
ncbi:MAG: putative signal transducing protein [Caulobacterales bacterium]|uniref:putative signal transducing protein n=1 Tax=Glycocaulis sp. TaxID=1969725 RepID=UPI003FA0F64F